MFEVRLSMSKIIGILGICIPVSLLVSFISYALVFRFITLSFADIVNQNWTLFLIFLVIQIVSIFSSIFFSFLIMEKTSLKKIRNSSFLSIGITLPLIIIISILGLALYNINFYLNLTWDRIFLVWPSIEIYFSAIVLHHVLTIIVINIVIYYIFFIIFLKWFTE